ncbi:AfsR/SARP family transcriptional regulator [Phytomonospora endophytica]|uniref:DNA-binding SARP family transcriptional activator n=1 Tax=Phytomonospora endophytica TaxID=714109 RepID=A0A841FS80_9ACTN|nr:AfsR/SARP family transcriptional regulator [Phytomonospora endophytica]MBB6036608.1 DNA-binding SARP family transcriptional activator [Phytomonospora endophytica]
MLLLDNKRVVPTERLIAALWDEDPPATARQQTQNLASAMRRDLAALGAPVLLDAVPGGYRIAVDDDQLDASVADAHAARARAEAAAGRRESALARFEQALALWRGPALAGLSGPVIEAAALRLDEARLALREECEETRLALGRHDEVIAATRALLTEQPYRQRTVATLITALDHSGRTSEALETYRMFRERLGDELGIDPGPEIKAAHLAVLRPETPPPPTTPAVVPATPSAPAELPADIPGFVGRDTELAALDNLDGHGLAVISGPPGVGKTALAVHWGQHNRSRFPGGQLHVDLRGHHSAEPALLIDVLWRFLRTLGANGELSPDVEEAAAAYRSMVADRALLVVLDNVATADQVRLLLPGGRASLALVTSRDNLSGLIARDGARPVRLRSLSDTDAVGLLAHVLGPEIADGEEGALRRLSELCGGLPLALRIAAANVLSQGDPTIAAYIDRLERDRLGGLAVDGEPDTAVDAMLRLSYEALGTTERMLFRRLGLISRGAFGNDLATVLLGADASVPLRRLLSQNLVETQSPGCYRLHDLVQDYAHQCSLADDPPDERAAAVTRLFEYHLDVHAEPTRDNRVYVAATAQSYPDHPMAWRLVYLLRNAINQDADMPNAQELLRIGYDSATAQNDVVGQARMRQLAASHLWLTGKDAEAVEVGEEALTLARRTGDTAIQALAIGTLAAFHSRRGRFADAAALHEEGLHLDAENAAAPPRLIMLVSLAGTRIMLGERVEAEKALAAAEKLAADLGGMWRGTVALSQSVHTREIGAHVTSRDQAQRALDLFVQEGNERTQIWALAARADALRELGEVTAARADAVEAMSVAEELGLDRQVSIVRTVLARALSACGDHAEALAQARLAISEQEERAAVGEVADSLCVLAEVHLGAADTAAALACVTRALETVGDLRMPGVSGRAHLLRGHALRAVGDVPGARDAWTRSLDAYRGWAEGHAMEVELLLGELAPWAGRRG